MKETTFYSYVSTALGLLEENFIVDSGIDRKVKLSKERQQLSEQANPSFRTLRCQISSNLISFSTVPSLPPPPNYTLLTY